MKMKQKAASVLLIATMMCTQSPIVFAMQENATTIKNDEVVAENINDSNNERLNILNVEAISLGDTIEDQGIIYEITRLPSGTIHGTVTLKTGNGAKGVVNIPTFISSNGKYDVTELADNAFKDNTELTSIDLSKTAVKRIGKYCFSNCTNLVDVKFREDTAIYLNLDTRAFENCVSLKELQFASVQILKSTIPFMNSGIQKITIMNPIQLGRYAFNGVQSGFTLNCPHKIPTVNNLDAEMFGMVQNVIFLVPNTDLKSRMETKFKSNTRVTVKLANENIEDTKAVVKDSKGQVLSYASLDEAFKGIDENNDKGPFTIYMSDNKTSISWPTNMPHKAVVLDFGQNQVELPESITLQAPLTIKNVLNFTNENKGVLCQLNANEHEFIMENGGSFGFSKIIGDNLTFKGRLPGSTSLGEQIQIKGYSDNAQITFDNIGRSDYYYNLPDIDKFTKLALNDTYFSANDKIINDLNIVMNDGGLKISGDAQIKSLSGTGEVRLTSNSSLVIDENAEGKFTLPENNDEDSKITVPVNSQIKFLDNGEKEVHVHSYKMSKDENQHWMECECGDKKDIENHQGGKANCHEKAICDNCGQEYGDFDLENHDGGTEIRGKVQAEIGKEGYTGDTYCLGCGQLLSKGEIIPALKDEKPLDNDNPQEGNQKPSGGNNFQEEGNQKPLDKNNHQENITLKSKEENNHQGKTIRNNKKTSSKVKTGDSSSIVEWGITFITSLCGMVLIKKKNIVK